MKQIWYGSTLAGALLTVTSSLFAQSTPSPSPTAGTSPVYTYVEQMPSFRGGGTDSVLTYIRHNTHYPAEAIQAGAVGRVFVSFVVNAQGQVEQAHVLKALHPALDQEALRVIATMPAWQPGQQQSKPVAVQMTVPINFAMQKASLPPASATSQAQYPGGPEALFTYLGAVPYPAEAQAVQAQGRLFVKVKLDEQGKVASAKLIAPFKGEQKGKSRSQTVNQKISRMLEEAALQWVSAMPAWSPAQAKGVPTSESITLPVIFSLSPATTSTEKVYAYADHMPVFATLTNRAGIQERISRAIRYPPQAMRNQVQGDGYVYFVVNEAGALEQAEIISSPGVELDKAVLDAVTMQPGAVAPAQHEGKPVKVFYVMPFSFKMTKTTTTRMF
jgi:TonB family protein